MSSAIDHALSQELRVAHPQTLDETLFLMEKIDQALTPDDGIWCFNHLYLMVTRALRIECRERRWQSPEWMEQLVVEFARLYFDALWLWLRGEIQATPKAWQPLFRARTWAKKRSYSQVQFALVGVNAHINRDLPFAASWACRRLGRVLMIGSPEYQDYIRVNKILEETEVEAMRSLASGWLKMTADFVHPYDRAAAMVLIRVSRWWAWRVAVLYHWLIVRSPWMANKLVRILDRTVGWVGYLFLLPTFSK